MINQIRTALEARSFMGAGNATVTLKSVVSGVHFTYRIRKSEDGQMQFVSVLTGSDNESSYSYLGFVRRDVYFHGRKSKIGEQAPSAKAFAWAWRSLAQGTMPPSLEVWHEGRCGRCNRKLTHPTSIATGLGPECAGRFEAVAA